ncbi:MAG: hypothetical protein HZB51_12635 [Chloroflexi bacterium]|nr:hypothetical protein [Chloroflexota bacterium]
MKTIDGSELTFRPLQAWSEYLQAEELQRVVWQMPDWRDVVPANLLITAHKNGGILLGAFDADQRMIGFAFSFLGVARDHAPKILKQCSHMLAVLPEYQGQKIGERLKFAQRDASLFQGIALMTWTYDPLLSLNASLNLTRLGAMARHYIVSAYGDMTDGLNAGLPSDRFEVEWWLNAPRVQACAHAAPARKTWDEALCSGAQPIFDVTLDARNLPRIVQIDEPNADILLLEIPAQLGALKSVDAALALDWRMQVRNAFLKLFNQGYVAFDFVFDARQAKSRAAYLLTRQPIDLGTS